MYGVAIFERFPRAPFYRLPAGQERSLGVESTMHRVEQLRGQMLESHRQLEKRMFGCEAKVRGGGAAI